MQPKRSLLQKLLPAYFATEPLLPDVLLVHVLLIGAPPRKLLLAINALELLL